MSVALVLLLPSGTSTTRTSNWYTSTTSSWHYSAVRSATRVPSTAGGAQSTASTIGDSRRGILSREVLPERVLPKRSSPEGPKRLSARAS